MTHRADGYAGYVTFCEGCGHDKARHRANRCWTDHTGEPVYRNRTLIVCLCDRFVPAAVTS